MTGGPWPRRPPHPMRLAAASPRSAASSDELLVTRQPERDHDLPPPCHPVEAAVEDLSTGHPELLLSDATQQIETFVSQHDAIHLDVSASSAALVAAAVVAHQRTLTLAASGPKVAPRHSAQRVATRHACRLSSWSAPPI